MRRITAAVDPARTRFRGLALASTVLGLLIATIVAPSSSRGEALMAETAYRTVEVDGLRVFYREAGRRDAPTLLLLHGFPSSSRMYEPLFARLADAHHLVAPDYIGFGHSDAPDPKTFDYTFDHLARVIEDFTEAVGLSRYSLYLQDYGGPVGFRLAIARPDRVAAIIIQNAVAHEDGLGALWETRRAFWADRKAYETALRENFLSLAATRQRHVGTSPRPWAYDPDLWTDEFAFLNRPGEADIQTDLFYDYRNNVASYPAWQAWLRRRQPPLLVLWAATTPRSRSRKSKPIAAMFRTARSTFSMLVTSPSTRGPRKSRLSRARFWLAEYRCIGRSLTAFEGQGHADRSDVLSSQRCQLFGRSAQLRSARIAGSKGGTDRC